MAKVLEMIWGGRKTEIFFQTEPDCPSQLEKSQQIALHAPRPWVAHVAGQYAGTSMRSSRAALRLRTNCRDTTDILRKRKSCRANANRIKRVATIKTMRRFPPKNAAPSQGATERSAVEVEIKHAGVGAVNYSRRDARRLPKPGRRRFNMT
jgi:hypothetical protein